MFEALPAAICENPHTVRTRLIESRGPTLQTLAEAKQRQTAGTKC